MTTLFILLTLIINELMQSNIDCVMDDMNQYPDSWVELYNPTDEAESLNTYHIGLTNNIDDAYKLPAKTIQGGEYIIICCDKENKYLHTHFRLDLDAGGAVYLFQNSILTDSVVRIPAMSSPNIAYGRMGDGSPLWGWRITSTPAAANDDRNCVGVLPAPTFNIPGRIYTPATSASTRLSFTLPSNAPDSAVIRYTTDGTEPNEQSPSYTGGTLVISKSTVVRARTFYDAYASAYSRTESYIYLDHETTLPVISLSTDPRNLNDNNIGIYVTGNNDNNPNYRQDWRRPFTFEYFQPNDTTATLHQLCEGRIQGAASRGFALKSMALYANKRFGEKHFKHEFFPEDKPGLKKFKSIALRNAGNDFDYLYMRDAIIQRAMGRNCDIEWQAYRPAVVIINGEYKGILNIRERANDHNIYTNYDGLEDVDVIENNGSIKSGTGDNWWAFKNFYNEHGHTWDEYEQWMDCEEYINLFIMDSYFANMDFPSNNICCWRPRNAEDGYPTRWRWIAKDCDYAMNIYSCADANYDYFYWLYNAGCDSKNNWGNSADGTRLFRRLMDDSTFHNRFINKAIVYTGDFLNYNRIWGEIWKPMYDAIRTEWAYHRPLYNQWWPNYNDELNIALNFLRARNLGYANTLGSYFGLGTPKSLDLFTYESDSTLTFSMHDVPLTRTEWHGYEYVNRDIRFEAHSDRVDDDAICWKVTHFAETPSVTTIHGAECTVRMELEDTRMTIELIEDKTMDIPVEQDYVTPVRKVLRNGHILIERGNQSYDLLGTPFTCIVLE